MNAVFFIPGNANLYTLMSMNTRKDGFMYKLTLHLPPDFPHTTNVGLVVFEDKDCPYNRVIFAVTAGYRTDDQQETLGVFLNMGMHKKIVAEMPFWSIELFNTLTADGGVNCKDPLHFLRCAMNVQLVEAFEGDVEESALNAFLMTHPVLSADNDHYCKNHTISHHLSKDTFIAGNFRNPHDNSFYIFVRTNYNYNGEN